MRHLSLILLCASVAISVGGCGPKRIIHTEWSQPSESAKLQRVPETSGENVTLGLQAAELARQQLGKPYQWGGAGPNNFDCSGLVYFVYGSLGVNLPRVVAGQVTAGQEVPRKRLQPGDLLFFAVDSSHVNHVGIAIGGHQFIHAPRRYLPVRVDDLNEDFWRQRLIRVRRINPGH